MKKTHKERLIKGQEELFETFKNNLDTNEVEGIKLFFEGYVAAQELAILQLKHDIYMCEENK